MHARSLLSVAAAAAFACALSNTGAAASTLYERLGGYGAIQAVVDQTIANWRRTAVSTSSLPMPTFPVCGAT